jgi:hypothetical protein
MSQYNPKREYYPLALVADMQSVTEEYLIHMGAIGKLPIYALLPGKPYVIYDVEPEYSMLFDYGLIDNNPVRITEASLKRWEADAEAFCEYRPSNEDGYSLYIVNSIQGLWRNGVDDSESVYHKFKDSKIVIMHNDLNIIGGKDNGIPGYLDSTHPRYSPKLAAAVKVWLAMEDESLVRGKPVMEAIQEWLTSGHKELGLTWEGKINRTGIEEVAKVANWKPKGGATKTPGG